MSQVFAGDSVNAVGNPNIPTTTATTIVTGNFVNPPFGNAKAIVSASVLFTVGTGATTVTVNLRRNPNAENLAVASFGGVPVTAGANANISVQYADAIPDARPVQYSLQVQQAGASGNGTVSLANITTLLISG